MRYLLSAALVFTALINTSANAEPVNTVTLDQVIQGALQKSTGISQVQKNYEGKLADGTEASVLDNPELQTDFVNKKGISGTGTDVEFTQPLKLSQLTGARWRYADLLQDTANSEQKYEILKVINETTSLYMRLWLLQERKKLYETSATDAGGMSKLVKSSAAQGQTSAAASHLFAADAEKLKADAASIGAELRQTRTELAKMTGRSFAGADLQKPVFSKIPVASDSLVNFAKDRGNLRNIIKAQIKAAEERVSIARQDAALPEINPRLVYSRSGNSDEKSYGVGVQLRIPLWNQNDAERRRANADLNFAKSQADILTTVPPEEIIGELQQSALAQAERADSYSEKVLPGYRKSYELTRAMFRQGQIDALEVWQVREKLISTENEALQSVAEAFNARGALELELGGKLEEIK
jgi:outer membrane protein TolC